jgi:type IV pilus assembly protein PilC
MTSFAYQARDNSGASVAGVLQAGTLEEASRQLRGEGKVIVTLHPESVDRRPPRAPRSRRVSQDDVLYFSNQLAVMVDTGVTVSEALDSIAQQSHNGGMKSLVNDIAAQVKAGGELSAALARHPKVFGDLYVNMVAASETSGTTGAMLQRVCEYLRSQREVRKQVRGAMLYPAGILTFSLVIVMLMMVFVLPRFEHIYAGKKAILPAPTRVLLAVGRGMAEYWAAWLFGLVAASAGAYYYLAGERGRYWLDRVKLRMPVAKSLFHKLYVSRSLRTLATMLSGGVEVLEAIRITARVSGNRLYRDMWLRVADQLKGGRTLAEEMREAPLISPSVAQMIACGDKSGRLADVMNRIADFCESDLRVGIKSLTALVEPAMIAFMGLVVGAIALALLLPVFSIGKVMAH